MKIRLNSGDRLRGGEVIIPVDPAPPIDLSDYFMLEIFETTDTEAPPFSEVTVNWKILPKNVETRFEDFAFRLIAPPLFIVNGITAEGAHDFTMMRRTTLRLQGRRNGSPWMPFGSAITVGIDESECTSVDLTRPMVDLGVFETVTDFLAKTAELRLRTVLLPADPQNPQAPRQRVQLPPESDWSAQRLRYHLPLEIVIPKYFNADLDVNMDVRLSVAHDDKGAEATVSIDFGIDVDFSTFEDIASIGSSVAVAKTVEALLPMVLECRKREIESLFAYTLFDNPGVKNALKEGLLLFDIRIDMFETSSVGNFVRIIFCPIPQEPEVPPGEVIAR